MATDRREKRHPDATERGASDPVARRMRTRRIASGLTLAALGQRVAAAPSHLCHIEGGEKVPNEDLAGRIAHALGDDEQAYRAWSRARAGSEFEAVAEAADRVRAFLLAAEEAGADIARLAAERAGPRPTRVLVPVLDPETPEAGATSSRAGESLRLAPNALAGIPDLERPFALALDPALTRRVPGRLPARGHAILTRRILPLRPDGVHAVRAGGRVELARALWNGRELIVLPAPGQSDFVVLGAADEATLRALVLGRVVLARAET